MKRKYKSNNYRIGYNQAVKDIEISLANVYESGFIIQPGSCFALANGITVYNQSGYKIYINGVGTTLLLTKENIKNEIS